MIFGRHPTEAARAEAAAEGLMYVHIGPKEVSVRHFTINFEGDDAFVIQDTQSTNGVFINDDEEALGAGQCKQLKDGDRIHTVKIVTATKRLVVAHH